MKSSVSDKMTGHHQLGPVHFVLIHVVIYVHKVKWVFSEVLHVFLKTLIKTPSTVCFEEQDRGTITALITTNTSKVNEPS